MIKPYLLFILISLFFINARAQNFISGPAMFHSNDARTGIYKATIYKKLKGVKWKFKTGGRIFSSPAIAGGIAYIGSEDSNFYALNASTGKLLWKLHTNGKVSSSPAVYNKIVYFTSYDGYCYAADAVTGKEIWKFKTGGEKKIGSYGLWKMRPPDMYMEDLWDFFLSSPVIEMSKNPTIFFGSSDGYVYAINALTGSLKWKFKTNGIIHSSPALYNGILYIGSWDTFLYAIDANTGKEKWKFKTNNDTVYHVLEGIQASPAVYDGMIYMGARDGYFYALNANNGTLIWKFAADNSWVLTTAAIKDTSVYFGTSDTYLLYALDAKTGKTKYSFKAKGYLYSSPAVSGNTAYFGDFTGELFALNLNSKGKTFDTFSTNNRNANAGKILNKNGYLDFSYKADKADLSLYSTNVKVMNQFYTLGSIVSSPAISDNTVFFGSADGFLYALSISGM